MTTTHVAFTPARARVPDREPGRGPGLTIDTNLIDLDRGGPEMARLRELDEDGWIQLMRTDAMDTEISKASEPKRSDLLELSAPYQEQLGVLVLGHSRLGSAMPGGPDDQAMWDKVWEVIHPGKDRATAREDHVKDAMHVWTSMRYGSTGLVTLDGTGPKPGLLDSAEAVKAAFNGFPIWTPAQALAYVERRKARHDARGHQGPSGLQG